ncbi:MAG: hypothetical protein PVH80_10675 [Anaerolineae bacterium]
MAISVVLAGGMLLVAIGVHLWTAFWRAPGLSPLASIAAWVAAGVLLVGALLVWGGRFPALESLVRPFDMVALPGPVLPMVLMAALAIPLSEEETGLKVKAAHGASWSRALVYLPALALTGALLIQVFTPTGDTPSADWVTPLRFLIAVCAGLGARALGQALQMIAKGPRCEEWPRTLTYGLLTLVVGSAALVNLWQEGIVWGGGDPVMRGGLAGAWLVWSVDWLGPRRHPRLRAAVTAMAALLLIVVAVREA